MSLFEEPHLEPQPEPEKPKKKKLLSVGIGAALIVAVLVTSVVAFSFGQSGKPADNVPDPPQREEVQTPSDTDTPSDESTDTEKPEAILSYNNRSILEGLSKIKFWSRILSHTVKELFRAFSYKKSRKPLKTKAFGVVGWRPREDLNLRPHA